MSRGSKEKMRRFEQRLREEGAEGFADGPRPWEHWDESGHQANNRTWEGSASRIHPRRRKTRSLGYRLLSALTFLSLATLLVGIGGVYFSHTQAQRLAQSGVQPLPSPPERSAMSAGNETVITASTSQMHDLNELSAPAAGSGATQDRTLAASETASAIDEAIPVADEPSLATETIEMAAIAPESTPPMVDNNIDSVSIETIVTKKSVTTTVYTRHPQDQEAEMVAAIETTPPPFAHKVVDEAQQALDAEQTTVNMSNDEAMTAAPSTTPPPVLQAVVADDVVTDTADNLVTTGADEYQYDDVPADNPATETDEENELAAWAEPIRLASAPGTAAEPLAPEQNITPAAQADDVATDTADNLDTTAADEYQYDDVPADNPATETDQEDELAAWAEPISMASAPGAAAEPLAPEQNITPAAQTEGATELAALEASAMVATPKPIEASISAEQAEDATVAAMAEADSVTVAPEVSEEQSNTRVAMVTPVAKTGDWVINLASYTWKSTADRKQVLFQQQGVDTEIFAVTINDKPMYRIRVTGFENSREAKAGIPAIEETLDLEGTWISRR